LSLFHTKAKTRKELIWGPFAHNKWVAFRNEEYTPTTNCVFLFTRTLRHHSCSVYFPFVANHIRSSAVLPCALEQPKFLDFPNHNLLLSLVDQTFDSKTATDFLFAQATMARASLSLHDISRVFRVLSITRFVRRSILFCFCYSKKSSSPWEPVQVVQERPRSVELFPSVT
jgi:hypothetical protein